ncbi:hypothetical protein Tco_0133624 [Tanacetum coccineum]
MSSEEPATQITPVESPQMVSTVKLPILKKGEYTLWSMRMEQYITNTDYSLWQVILNDDGPIQVTTDENSVKTEVPPKTAQALLQRQRERKAKSILILAILDDLDYEEKDGIDDLDIDDLYNNLKMFKADIKGSSGSSSNSQNVAFLSAEDTSSSNESNSPQLDNEDLEQIDHDDLEEMDLKWECRAPRNQGNMNGDAGYRSRDNTKRTVPVETSNALFALMAYTANSSESNTELGLKSVEAQLIVHKKNEVVYEEKIVVLEFEVKDKKQFETSSKNLNKLINSQLSAKDKTGLGYGDQLNENDSSGSELFNSVFDSYSSDGDDNKKNDRFKKDNGYHAIPHPLTGNYMPPLADLSFARLDDSIYRPTTNKTSASVSQWSFQGKQQFSAVKGTGGVTAIKGLSRDNLQTAFKRKQRNILTVMFRQHCQRTKSSYDYQDIDGGFVAFGESVRGGKITGKGKIRTVLFTETECLVLSPDFKLLNESQVLLRVPKQSNMYSFDLKNVVPFGDLTCLLAKSTIDESKLLHGRMDHQANKFHELFGCPVTILNTLDPLGKFDGKAEEWFLVSSDDKYKNDTAHDAAGEKPKEATEQSNAVRKEFEAQCNRELLQGKATRASSTNSFNTVSTPVNAASAPRTFNDVGPSFVALSGSFPLDVNDPLDDLLMPNLEDTVVVPNTGIFGSAYDDDLDTCNSPYAD